MANFIALTRRSGRAVHVNLDLVEYVSDEGAGAALTFTHLPWFSTDRLVVRESPDEIVALSQVSAR